MEVSSTSQGHLTSDLQGSEQLTKVKFLPLVPPKQKTCLSTEKSNIEEYGVENYSGAEPIYAELNWPDDHDHSAAVQAEIHPAKALNLEAEIKNSAEALDHKPEIKNQAEAFYPPSEPNNPAEALCNQEIKNPAEALFHQENPAEAERHQEIKNLAEASLHHEIKNPAEAECHQEIKNPAEAECHQEIRNPAEAERHQETKKLAEPLCHEAETQQNQNIEAEMMNAAEVKNEAERILDIEPLLDDDMFQILDTDPWAEVIVSPLVHHNLLTSEICIPCPPGLSTSLTSLTLHTIEKGRCGSEEKIEAKLPLCPKSEANKEVRCPQTNTLNPEFTQIEIRNSDTLPALASTGSISPAPSPAPVPDTRIPSVGDDDTEFEEGDNTVIVSKLQELVIQKNMKNVTEFCNVIPTSDPYRIANTEPYRIGMTSSVHNPLPPSSATCVKYKVHQSPNGVTTISIDPKAEPVTLLTSLPVIHHVINLPPRKVDSLRLRNRRRKTSDESNTYGKSIRLSQLMLTDYKINADRPPSMSSNNRTVGNGIRNGTGIPNNGFVKGNMESMKRKVGSWYRRKVKTPVERLGLDSIKFPISLPFKCGSNHTGGGVNGVNTLNGVNSLEDSVDGVEIPEVIDELEGVRMTDQRFVEGLACDQGQNEFEELRRVVKQGGDFCKDLAAVLQERSELEASYAKGLSKLSAKLLKASKEATGSVAHAWQAVAVQIDTQAELHRIWSTALLDDVAKPLRNSTETQHKIRKSVEVLVEKTTRNLAEWRIAEAKAKRQCFSSSKEFEKIQENVVTTPLTTTPLSNGTGPASNGGTLNNLSTTNLHNQANSVLAEVRARSRVLSLPPPDKDPIKLEAKRRKAEEAVRRADIEYYTFCVRSERARLEWEGAIRNGSTCLRTLEEEKLALLKDLASKYFQHFNDFIPKLLRSSDSLEEPITTCNVNQDMTSVVDIRRHAGSEQLLPDFYAEDTSNLMKKERRMEALQKFLYVIKQDLERERKGASSIESMSRTMTSGDPAPKLETAHHDLSDRLYYLKAMLLYLEGARTKVENAVADQEGRQRVNSPITQYMRHQRDKQGLPQTILKVPTWARDECLNYTSTSAADSGSGGSISPDWREKDHVLRSPADGNSNGHDVDFDEFSSEGSEQLNEDVFEDSTSQPITVVETNGVNGVKDLSDLVTVPIPNISPSIGQCRVIYDYDSNMFDELTIRTGEILNVHDKQEDGWWLGELNGQIGIFPATYVEEILNN